MSTRNLSRVDADCSQDLQSSHTQERNMKKGKGRAALEEKLEHKNVDARAKRRCNATCH
jgi:hypothetical protein